jgi:hypothetical protein
MPTQGRRRGCPRPGTPHRRLHRTGDRPVADRPDQADVDRPDQADVDRPDQADGGRRSRHAAGRGRGRAKFGSNLLRRLHAAVELPTGFRSIQRKPVVMTRLLTVLVALVALALYPALVDAKGTPPRGVAAPPTPAPRPTTTELAGNRRPSPSSAVTEPAPPTSSAPSTTAAPPIAAAPPTTAAAPPTTVAPRSPTIAVVGDSLLMQSWQQVHGALSAGGYTPEMISKPASGLADPSFFDWGAQLRTLDAEARPDQLVVELGTNDLGQPEFYESGLTIDLVMETSRARRVVWVLPSANPLRPDRQFNMERIRSALLAAAAQGRHAERLDVVDFDRAVSAVPGAMEPDLIHVTPYGSQLLADLIRSGVDASP